MTKIFKFIEHHARRFSAWCRALFNRPAVEPVVSAPEIKEPDRKPARKPRAVEDVAEDGVWRFRRNVLDRLGTYFEVVEVLRAKRPDVYAEFARIGAAVSADNLTLRSLDAKAVLATNDIRAIGFGAAAPFLSADDSGDYMNVRLITFQRLDRVSPGVQHTNGTTFHLVVVYMLANDKPFVGDFYVSVADDGTITPLKTLAVARQSVRHRRRAYDGRRTSTVYHLHWQIPELLRLMGEERPDTDPEKAAAIMFLWAYTAYLNSQGGARVRIEKNGLVAAIGVDMLRVPAFFSDRDKVVEDGRTRRIFHIVRTHAREARDGTVRYVKSHFRGLRRFTWNGYRVSISIPGYHHAPIYGMNLGAREYADGEQLPQNFIDKSAAVEKIARAMER